MKKFTKSTNYRDVYEMMVYAHHPDLRTASLSELEEFLCVLLECFPSTKISGTDAMKPYDESTPYMQLWRAAYQHVEQRIHTKKSAIRFKLSILISILTLLILVLTLSFQVIGPNKHTKIPDKNIETTINVSDIE